MGSRKAQVAIFVIVAIVIVAGIILYFALSGPSVSTVPQNMKPAYDYYLGCVENTAREGIALLGEQGGYIEVPDFIPGSQYMPFSSQLDFYGQPVPYWLYVSGNNILSEQVPTRNDMEQQLEEYLEARLDYCDFADFEMQGFDVIVHEGAVNVDIKDSAVELDVNNDVVIGFGEEVVQVSDHVLSVDSRLGRFHDLALDVYNYEKENMFLESYAVDVLNLYAPVTGVDLSCTPKVFVDELIVQNLTDALVANIGALKLEGNYYDLAKAENDYFVTDIGRSVNENVNFIYNANWPTRVEIYGDRVVEPVGMQEGLGVLGFCYVPYHLVYDVNFPVLIQFWNEEELFQFPIAVVIHRNQAREALEGEAGVSIESPVCEYPNQEVRVATYDANLNPVEAQIRFRCLSSECTIGGTVSTGGEAVLDALMPRCVNGFVAASAEGYATSKAMISTNEEDYVDVIMNKIYEVPVSLSSENNQALVSFKSDDYSATIMYPDQKEIGLIEGYYNVTVYVYSDSSLTFPAVSDRKCFMVPKPGVAGMLGLEEEKCVDIDLPEYDVDFALIGGGHQVEYVTEGQLASASKVDMVVPLVGVPTSINDLQNNYIEIEESKLVVSFA